MSKFTLKLLVNVALYGSAVIGGWASGASVVQPSFALNVVMLAMGVIGGIACTWSAIINKPRLFIEIAAKIEMLN